VPAVGRLKAAGITIGGGGLSLVLSAFLPWVTSLGIASARPAGGGVVVILVLGGTLGFLATRVLMDKATKAVRVLLWVLAAIDALVVLGFFTALKVAQGVGGVFQAADIVRPAFGFYLALIALLASIVGTIVMQTAHSAPTTAQPGVPHPQWSPGYPPAPTDRIPPPGWNRATPEHPAPMAHPVPAQPGQVWWDGTGYRAISA